jgi:hypothetical protein
MIDENRFRRTSSNRFRADVRECSITRQGDATNPETVNRSEGRGAHATYPVVWRPDRQPLGWLAPGSRGSTS